MDHDYQACCVDFARLKLLVKGILNVRGDRLIAGKDLGETRESFYGYLVHIKVFYNCQDGAPHLLIPFSAREDAFQSPAEYRNLVN